MINFLMESEKDITLLTCKECAFEIYKTLSKIIKEDNNDLFTNYRKQDSHPVQKKKYFLQQTRQYERAKSIYH